MRIPVLIFRLFAATGGGTHVPRVRPWAFVPGACWWRMSVEGPPRSHLWDVLRSCVRNQQPPGTTPEGMSNSNPEQTLRGGTSSTPELTGSRTHGIEAHRPVQRSEEREKSRTTVRESRSGSAAVPCPSHTFPIPGGRFPLSGIGRQPALPGRKLPRRENANGGSNSGTVGQFWRQGGGATGGLAAAQGPWRGSQVGRNQGSCGCGQPLTQPSPNIPRLTCEAPTPDDMPGALQKLAHRWSGR